jgi:hypothetical protein
VIRRAFGRGESASVSPGSGVVSSVRVLRDESCEVRGVSAVTVVEPDRAQAAGGQFPAKTFVPAQHLAAQTHDQEEWWCVDFPKGFIAFSGRDSPDSRHRILQSLDAL